MPNDRTELSRTGGAAFIVGGVLFFARYVLEVMAGPPPSSGGEILVWVETNRFVLSLVSEVLFFASMSLIPAVIALYLRLASVERALAAIGCAVIAVVIPVLSVLLIVHGRLVYPVYGLDITAPGLAEFVVAVFYGGVHAVGLLMAVATFLLSLAMWRAVFGAWVAALGFVAVIADVVGAYPYLISPVVLFVCQLLFAAWFVAVGLKLFRTREAGSK